MHFGLQAFDRRAILDERRHFTRRLAGVWRSAAVLGSGDLLIQGLRFRSRLPPAWICWALWDPLPLDASTARQERVMIKHPALRAAARKLGGRACRVGSPRLRCDDQFIQPSKPPGVRVGTETSCVNPSSANSFEGPGGGEGSSRLETEVPRAGRYSIRAGRERRTATCGLCNAQPVSAGQPAVALQRCVLCGATRGLAERVRAVKSRRYAARCARP